MGQGSGVFYKAFESFIVGQYIRDSFDPNERQQIIAIEVDNENVYLYVAATGVDSMEKNTEYDERNELRGKRFQTIINASKETVIIE